VVDPPGPYQQISAVCHATTRRRLVAVKTVESDDRLAASESAADDVIGGDPVQ
jgi:hypothetical protein